MFPLLHARHVESHGVAAVDGYLPRIGLLHGLVVDRDVKAVPLHHIGPQVSHHCGECHRLRVIWSRHVGHAAYSHLVLRHGFPLHERLYADRAPCGGPSVLTVVVYLVAVRVFLAADSYTSRLLERRLVAYRDSVALADGVGLVKHNLVPACLEASEFLAVDVFVVFRILLYIQIAV